MASYSIIEGSIFEKSGDSYKIAGIEFTTSVGSLYCPEGTIRPDNCVDKNGNLVNTTDVTEAQAKAHLQWMASDFESRGSGVSGETVVVRIKVETNKGTIYLSEEATQAVSVDIEKKEVVIDEAVVKESVEASVEEKK